MPRKRIIDPEFWSDEEIGQWSFQARLFYIGLWNFSDDEGRFKAHDNLLKSQIFPYDEKIDLKKLKIEITAKVKWYSVNGSSYGYLPNFLKHQRIDKPSPSKIPIFDEHSTNAQRTIEDDSRLREVKLSKVKLSEDKLIYVDFEKSTVASWNSFCDTYPTLPKIKDVSKSRRESLKTRFEEENFRDFGKILEAIKLQTFCRGENDRKWKVSFDWLIKNDTNYLKVLEKKYLSKKSTDASYEATQKYLKDMEQENEDNRE